MIKGQRPDIEATQEGRDAATYKQRERERERETETETETETESEKGRGQCWRTEPEALKFLGGVRG